MLSSKGQLVLPKAVRERHGWEKGTIVAVQDSFQGVMIFEVPKKPLAALCGMLKDSGLSTADLFKERRREWKRESK